MTQGFQNKAKKPAKSIKSMQKLVAAKKNAKKGNPIQLPKQSNIFRNEALEDRDLTKAINKVNEQKISAKVLQAGGHMKTKDLFQRGKELAKQQRRDQVKKKVTRVEEKLAELKKATENL